jgi:hypothetical protein
LDFLLHIGLVLLKSVLPSAELDLKDQTLEITIMATGACGINCDVCRLNIIGTCSTCGAGTSREAASKLEVQKKLFGSGCPILECAHLNSVNYCMCDCDLFPCENFRMGPYPFSSGFLDMQKRRLSQNPPALTPQGKDIIVPTEYWDSLVKRDIRALSNFTLTTPCDEGIVFLFLNREILIDFNEKCMKRKGSAGWQRLEDPLLELITLLYFNRVDALYPKGKGLVSTKDLKEGHFFKGPHALNMGPFLQRYKDNLKDFADAAKALKGEPMDMADASFMFLPFPRVPLYYLLWKKDNEFEASVDILFDMSIERCLDAAGIWGLVNLVTRCILQAKNN